MLALAGLPPPGRCRAESLTVKEMERRIDLVITPDDESLPLTVVEVQFQRDPLIFVRIVLEMAHIQLKHPKREVQGVVLFSSAAADPRQPSRWRNMVSVVHLDRTLEQWRREDPDHPLPGVFAPVLLRHDELAARAKQCYLSFRKKGLSLHVREILERVFVALLADRFPTTTFTEISMLLNLTDIEKTAGGRELLAKGEARTIAQIAKQRFSDLPARTVSAIENLPSSVVKKLTAVILKITDRKELEAWLKLQGPKKPQ